MPCENYRDALTDAAAARAALRGELRAHVEACPACRAFHAGEQQLFAAIDSGVSAFANAELPLSFVAPVHAELNAQQVPRQLWLPLGAALASAALLLMIVLLARGYTHHGSDSNPQTSTIARRAAPTEIPAAPAPAIIRSRTPAPRREPSRRVMIPAAVTSTEAAVLVPAGQKKVMDALLVALRTGAVDGDILVADKAQKTSHTGEPAPLTISPIEIKPLAPVSEESVAENEKTRR